MKERTCKFFVPKCFNTFCTDFSLPVLKKLKQESGGIGEQLMKQLEQLDQLRFSEEQLAARSTRKQLATLLNRALDRNDQNIETLAGMIDKQQCVL